MFHLTFNIWFHISIAWPIIGLQKYAQVLGSTRYFFYQLQLSHETTKEGAPWHRSSAPNCIGLCWQMPFYASNFLVICLACRRSADQLTDPSLSWSCFIPCPVRPSPYPSILRSKAFEGQFKSQVEGQVKSQPAAAYRFPAGRPSLFMCGVFLRRLCACSLYMCAQQY